MGKKIKLYTGSIGSIIPIEAGLREDDIKKIVRAHFASPKKVVVPVRVHPYNSKLLVLLDGHNTTCVADVLNEENPGAFELYGWVAESKSDFIPRFSADYLITDGMGDVCIENHYGLKCVHSGRFRLDVEGVPDSISELRARYDFLNSADALRKFVFG